MRCLMLSFADPKGTDAFITFKKQFTTCPNIVSYIWCITFYI